MNFITLLLLSTMMLATAQAQETTSIAKKMRLLPIHGLAMVENNGKTVLVSTNSRFMITNFTLYDLLNKQEIKNLEDAKSLDKIFLDKIKLNFSELGSIDYGSGKAEVTIFVDPLCPHCKKLLSDVKGLSERYYFHVIVTPLLGQPSLTAARKILCHKRKSARFDLLAKGDYASIDDPRQECGVEQVKKVLITSNIMGFQAVPFIIAPDGTSSTGVPSKGLLNWLTEHKRGQ